MFYFCSSTLLVVGNEKELTWGQNYSIKKCENSHATFLLILSRFSSFLLIVIEEIVVKWKGRKIAMENHCENCGKSEMKKILSFCVIWEEIPWENWRFSVRNFNFFNFFLIFFWFFKFFFLIFWNFWKIFEFFENFWNKSQKFSMIIENGEKRRKTR